MSLQVKIKNISTNSLPNYETFGSAGLDLRAFIPEPLILTPFQRILIPTGLFLELPLGYEAQIRPRSGLALKNGITVLNSPGTIDADYRGELKIILINLSQEPFSIHNGDRIAQMIVAKHERLNWQLVEQIHPSERGEQGFGHTGMN